MERRRGGVYQPPRRRRPSTNRSSSSDISFPENCNPDRSISSQAASTGELVRDRLSDPSADPLVGTCRDMCPAKERAERERLRDLAIFERLHGNPVKTSEHLAVKKFCRSITKAHVQSGDIRPLHVLQKTLEYLLDLVESSEHPFEVVHDFVFDRTRSMRQDLSIQNIINDESIYLYEEMVKFHISSHKKLVMSCCNSSSSSLSYLNMEQLRKCLLSLFDMYKIDQRFNSTRKNEAEFYSLYVLLHLGCKAAEMGDSLSSWFRRLPYQIIHAKEVQFARNTLKYCRLGNYKRFFSTLAPEGTYLQLCLIEPFLDEVRMQALICMNHSGYKLHPYPLNHLARLLMIKEEELELLCSECGLEVGADEQDKKYLPAKQTTFRRPTERKRIFGLHKFG